MRARKPLIWGCLLASIAGAYAPDCMQLQGKLQNDLGPKGVCCDEGSCDGQGNTPTTCPPACAEVFIDSWKKCAGMWSGYFISVGQGAYADALNRFFHLCKDAELANECDEDQQWSPSVGRCEPCPPHSDTDGKRQTKGEGGKTLCGCSKGYFGYSPTHADGHGACEQCPEGKFRSTWGPACQDCSLSSSAVASLRDRDCVDNVGRGSETDYTDDQDCARLCAGEDDCVDELTDDTDCGSLCQRDAINPRMCCPDPKVQDECSDCPTGSTAAPDRTYCICPADRYWDSDERTCVSCPENAGTDGATGKMSIDDCKCNEGYGRDRDPDTFHDDGCTLCLTPSISLETSWGRVCGCRDGYYEDPDSPEDGCKSCGWGPGTDVTQWDPQCNCRPGYKRDATGACVKCPRNMFRSCVTSPGPHERDLCQNENDDSGKEVCISCDTVADFSITDGTAKASSHDCICPPNSEMDGGGDDGNCPPDCGRKHLAKCICAVGFVQNDITGRCAACPQDSYRDGADGKCTSCATHDSNMVTNASIALSPDACLCKAGWWGGWNSDGSALCEQCDVDSYKGRDANDLHCSACPKAASTYGLTARTDITDCLCEPGYRRDPQAAYHDDVPLCAPCPEGTFSASRDSTMCTACPDNSGAAVATQASCDCAEGYETAADGSSKTTGDACVKAAPHPIELDKLPSVYYNVAIATMVVLFCCVAAMYHRARRAADNANAAAMQLLLGSPAEMKLGASSEGRRTVFASMRFPDGQPLPHAIKLQAALKKTGVDMTIIRLDGVADITKEVFQGIEEAGAFIAFGTKSYAEDTGNPACSYYELKHAQASNKPIILIRMIPWEEQFDHLLARVVFGQNRMATLWLETQPEVPADLVLNVKKALLLPDSPPAPKDSQTPQSSPTAAVEARGDGDAEAGPGTDGPAAAATP